MKAIGQAGADCREGSIVKNGIETGTVGLLLCCVLLFFLAGCAAKQETAIDPFFEKWSTMAEENQGASPSARKRVMDIPGDPAEFQPRSPALAAVEKTRDLPDKSVSLKMRNADVATVLRALARAADQNILIRSEVGGVISVDFNKVPWNEAFVGILRSQALTYMWEGDIIRVATLQDLESDLQMEAIRERRLEQEVLRSRLAPLHTMVIPVDYANAKRLKDELMIFLTRKEDNTSHGSIEVSEHTNSLIVQATRADFEKIIPLVEKIDRPTAQVRIEANIVETTSDTARDLGVRWGGLYRNVVGSRDYWITPGGAGSTTPADPVGGGYTPDYGSPGLSGHGLGVNFPASASAIDAAGGMGSLGLMYGILGGSILELQLQALQKAGQLNILSRPSITTLDNQMAFTENGEKIPFVTIEDNDRTVRFEEAVLRLEITPNVIDDDTLKLKIVIKKDEVDFTRTVDGNPVIIKKQTDTSLIVNDGETIVISGLSKQQNRRLDSGVPALSTIPGLGWLFKSQGRSRQMEEVLIFITPRILKTRNAGFEAEERG
ncbi:MAG: type IV pilus secretin PilQ [Syntrophales bacterium]|jgi:type IV pilus assembly protein PilQ|nr:type IV pilus secretin PilQ [Syntrophales bacterium]MCK9528585.1 type IV pilus secretin PilQ [Syntrophales bacterium]MDX9922778.1 type IV pilus secretin PilQ [Syntrophales bacterium]